MRPRAIQDNISLFSLREDLVGYKWSDLRSDSVAALTVALVSVPQSIAYALAAGLPPAVGIFAAIFGAIFGAAFGSSRHLVLGPTNTMAILIETAVSEVLYTYYRDAPPEARGALSMTILLQLTVLVGLIQLTIALFKLGKLTQFVSRSVLVGYVSGAAIAIVSDQLFYLFGVVTPHDPRSLLEKMISFARGFELLHVPTAVIGVGSLAFLFLVHRVHKKIPSAIVVIVVSGLAVWFLHLADPAVHPNAVTPTQWQRVAIVNDLGEIQTSLPQFSIPYFEFSALNELIPIAFAIALLGILETTSIARSLASESGQRLSTNQELFGLGFANTVASLFGAMPSSGSFARSYINISGGAKTRFAAIFSGIFAAVCVLIFKTQLQMIPLAALAALLIASTPRMVKWPELITCFRATAADAIVLSMTLVSCVLFRLDTAFYIGVILSIMLYLKKASTPSLAEYQLTKEGLMRAIGKERRLDNRIRIIHVEGEIFFGAADLLQETLSALAEDPEVRIIVLHLKNARQFDATACLVMQQIYRYLKGSGRYLIASGLTRQGWKVFCDSGLTREIGKENLFLNDDHRPHHSSRLAFARAMSMLQSSQEETPGQTPLSPLRSMT